ncbi:myb domain protein 4r1 [Malassezia pachydermatis]|uniref:Myb domain protein 4r1 n=1 Tax=Malassezia pachydermatis TaxID=77020 RepID=A0A0M8MSF8_9BASI|nr:myb domain protein 4r1 [Malassezia pachydermatis]KOS13414.1 myb domain protein 4r1 [Malassezia pachydermatis]
MTPGTTSWTSEEAELAVLESAYSHLDALDQIALEQESAQREALAALEAERRSIEEALRQLDVHDRQEAQNRVLVVGPMESKTYYPMPLLREADLQAMPLLHTHAMHRRQVCHLLSSPPWSARDTECLHMAMNNERTRQAMLHNDHSTLDWTQIAMSVPFHTPTDCETRWRFFENPLLNQAKPSATEKRDIITLVQRSASPLWEDIAATLQPGRTGYLALEVYQRSAKPSIEWTKERDDALLKAVRELGPDWKAVAARLGYPLACATLCHRRHNKLKSSAVVMGRWSPEEDAALRAAVAQFGCDWKRVEICVQGRTGQQCRERWVGRLANMPEGVTQAVRRAWSKEEDDRLRACVHTCKTWVQVAE